MIFYKAIPVLIADLKTTSRSSLWPGHDKPVQVRTYGLGLDYMGFDCSELKLMIGVEHTGIRKYFGYSPYKQDLSAIRLLLEKEGEIEKIERIPAEEGYRRWIHNYDKDQALDEFRWASDYWLGERDAVPTKKQGKCKACEYQESCSKSSA